MPSQLGPGSAMPVGHQRPVDHAEGGIEDPLPGDGRQHGRHDERQQQQRARQVLEPEILVHHQREPEPADHLQERRGDGVDEGVDHHLPEHRVVPVGDEVVEADEHARLGHRPVLQAEPDAVEERIADQRHQEGDRRRHHQPAEHAFALQPACRARTRGAGAPAAGASTAVIAPTPACRSASAAPWRRRSPPWSTCRRRPWRTCR